MNRLFEERRPKYSRALLETIAIIAYRQPITRGEIESIRGVAVSTNIIRTLLEREWVRVVGHRDVPGKPAVYATTKMFLDYFNLASIDELPSLAELKDFDDPSAFLLGFFVTLSVRRWWDQYQAIPCPDDLSIVMTGLKTCIFWPKSNSKCTI